MAEIFYGGELPNANSNPLVYTSNANSIYSASVLIDKYFTVEGTKFFSQNRLEKIGSYIRKGYYPNRILCEVGKSANSYNELSALFKLE